MTSSKPWRRISRLLSRDPWGGKPPKLAPPEPDEEVEEHEADADASAQPVRATPYQALLTSRSTPPMPSPSTTPPAAGAAAAPESSHSLWPTPASEPELRLPTRRTLVPFPRETASPAVVPEPSPTALPAQRGHGLTVDSATEATPPEFSSPVPLPTPVFASSSVARRPAPPPPGVAASAFLRAAPWN